jgi:hypothetical protein
MATNININLPASVSSKLSLTSYNMHGFNQGSVFLEDVCKSETIDGIVQLNIGDSLLVCTRYLK